MVNGSSPPLASAVGSGDGVSISASCVRRFPTSLASRFNGSAVVVDVIGIRFKHGYR